MDVLMATDARTEQTIVADAFDVRRPDLAACLTVIERFNRRACIIIKSLNKPIMSVNPERGDNQNGDAHKRSRSLSADPTQTQISYSRDR